MYIPEIKSPTVKKAMPTRSSCRQSCSTLWEWFSKVWYIVDSPKQITAVKRKKANMR
jgi:hypothetical protein